LATLALLEDDDSSSDSMADTSSGEDGPGRGRGPRAPMVKEPSRNVYEHLVQNHQEFRRSCRFTPEQFRELVEELRPAILRARDVRHEHNDADNARRPRSTKLCVEDRLLCLLIFLRSGMALSDLSIMFGWSKASINDDLKHVLRAVYETIAHEIRWPTAD